MKNKNYPFTFNWNASKLLLLFTGLLFNTPFSKAQVTFEKKYGGVLQESARSMEIVSDGYLILGSTTTYSAAGDTDVYIIRTNTLGETLWTKTIGGKGHDVGYSIKATGDGNFIIAGSSGIDALSNSDAWLFKIDKDANVLWSKKYETPGTDVALDIQKTSDNGFIITGYTQVGADGNNAFLWRTDGDGKLIWYKTYGGNKDDEGHSVKQTADGGFIFIGQTYSFGAGDLDFYVVKTSSDGTIEWTKTYGGIDFDRGQDLEIISGGYILTGDTKNYGAGDYDAYVISIDASGGIIWTKTYGGTDKDITKMIQKTSDDGYIIAGITRSFGLINPNMWLIKIKSTGDTTWTRNFGGPNHEHCYYAKQTADGGYIALGHSVIAYTPIYDVDIYFLKLNSEGLTAPTGLNDIALNNNLAVYPNPNSGVFEIQLKAENSESLELQLTDIFGRIIYKEKPTVINKNYSKNIDISGISKGIYFLNFSNSNQHLTKKIVVY